MPIYRIFLLLFTPFVCFSQPVGRVLNTTTSVKIENGFKVSETEYLIQINEKDGAWLSQVDIPEHGLSKVQILEGEVRDNQGNVIRKLKKKDISKSSNIHSQALYSDSYIYSFNLSHYHYPYQIYFKYKSTESQFISIAYWYPDYRSSIPTDLATLSVTIPKDQSIHFKEYGDFKYQKEESSLSTHHKWEIRNLDAYVTETYAPPFAETFPHVYVVPDQFRYEMPGSAATWEDYGDWIFRVNRELTFLPSEEKLKAIQLINGISDTVKIIETLYKYLQDNHRYVNVSIETGGLKPYPARYVCEKRYGDCKALTIYMKALLQAVGIPSHYTIIYSGENPVKVDQSLPGHQWNHVVLAVPVGQDTLWLENTNNHLPVNYVNSFTQNRTALLVDDNGQSHLVKTKAFTPELVRSSRTFHVELNDTGDTEGKFKSEIRGPLYVSANHYLKNGTVEQREKWVRHFIPIENVFTKDIEIKEHDEYSYQVNCDFQWKQAVRKVGADIFIYFLPELELPDLEEPDERIHPLRIAIPMSFTDTFNISIAIPTQKTQAPTNFELASRFGNYSLQSLPSETENQMHLVRNYTLLAGDYPLTDYKDFYLFVEEIRKFEKSAYTLYQQSSP